MGLPCYDDKRADRDEEDLMSINKLQDERKKIYTQHHRNQIKIYTPMPTQSYHLPPLTHRSRTLSLSIRQNPPMSISIRQLLRRRTQFRVRVRALVFERLDEFVEEDGEEGAADGTDPVDPLGGVEGVDCDCGAEGAGGVEGAAGPEDAWVEGWMLGLGLLIKEDGFGDRKKKMEVSWVWEVE